MRSGLYTILFINTYWHIDITLCKKNYYDQHSFYVMV